LSSYFTRVSDAAATAVFVIIFVDLLFQLPVLFT